MKDDMSKYKPSLSLPEIKASSQILEDRKLNFIFPGLS